MNTLLWSRWQSSTPYFFQSCRKAPWALDEWPATSRATQGTHLVVYWKEVRWQQKRLSQMVMMFGLGTRAGLSTSIELCVAIQSSESTRVTESSNLSFGGSVKLCIKLDFSVVSMIPDTLEPTTLIAARNT